MRLVNATACGSVWFRFEVAGISSAFGELRLNNLHVLPPSVFVTVCL